MANVIIKNQFASKYASSKVANPHGYVSKYSTRPDAVQAYITSQDEFDALIKRVFYYFDDNSQYSTQHMLNQELNYMGTAFDLDNLACSRSEVLELANLAQAAYDRGATVREFVISFDSNFLSNINILDDTIDPNVVVPGSLFGHIDETNIRLAVQHSFQTVIPRLNLKDPKLCCAIQADTTNVHVHGVLFDNDPTVVNDRGKISANVNSFICDMLAHELSQSTVHIYNPLEGLRWAVDVQKQSRPLKELNLHYSLSYLDLEKYQDEVINYTAKKDDTLSEEMINATLKQDSVIHDYATYSHLRKGSFNRIFAKEVVNEFSDFLLSPAISDTAKKVMIPYFKGELSLYGSRSNYHQALFSTSIYSRYHRMENVLNQEYQRLSNMRANLIDNLAVSPGNVRSAKQLLSVNNDTFSDELTTGLFELAYHQRPLSSKHVKELSKYVDAKTVKDKFVPNLSLNNYLVRKFQQELLEYQFLLFENGAMPGEQLGQNLDEVPIPENPSTWLNDSEYRKRISQSDYANDVLDYNFSIGSHVRTKLVANYIERSKYLQFANAYLNDTNNQSLKSIVWANDNSSQEKKVLQPTLLEPKPVKPRVHSKSVPRLVSDFVKKHVKNVISKVKTELHNVLER